MHRTLAILAACGALAAAGEAAAHAHLTASTPAANAAVPAPKEIVLTFTEPLQPKFSGLAITMPAMNNMAVPAKVSVSGKTMTAIPATPLAAGAYQVRWHAVTADTHRVEGQLSFSVH